MSEPTTAPLIPLSDRDNVDRGNYVTRALLQWLTDRLPIDGSSPKNWPVRTGSPSLGDETDPFARAMAAAQWVLERYGSLLGEPKHRNREVVRLWALVRSNTIVALAEERPPLGTDALELWLIPNARGGLTLLFRGEFQSLPAEYRLQSVI